MILYLTRILHHQSLLYYHTTKNFATNLNIQFKNKPLHRQKCIITALKLNLLQILFYFLKSQNLRLYLFFANYRQETELSKLKNE